MPRDKVALLINSCAKKPKPRRVTPSAPRPAQRSEHIDDALMATKRRRVAFGDVSIHVFPMAIAAVVMASIQYVGIHVKVSLLR